MDRLAVTESPVQQLHGQGCDDSHHSDITLNGWPGCRCLYWFEYLTFAQVLNIIMEIEGAAVIKVKDHGSASHAGMLGTPSRLEFLCHTHNSTVVVPPVPARTPAADSNLPDT